MKVVYIAGPFTAPTAWAIEQNIRAVEDLGILVAKMGFAPLMPHVNTRFFHGTCTPEFWYQAAEAMLLKSDGVLFREGWSGSLGCRMELAAAESANIPRFFTLAELETWKHQIFTCGSPCLDVVGLVCMKDPGHPGSCQGREHSGLLRLWSKGLGSPAASGR